MDADSSTTGWLLLLSQLPRTPSSARVAAWRRLRAAGATMMVNSAWVLPDTPLHAGLFRQLRDGIAAQGGTAFVLSVPVSAPELAQEIVRRFRADRGQEYDEFTERCTALLQEIGRETSGGKYTFAELEEGEQDLEKLARWLVKIQERDFFPDDKGQQSAALLARCRSAVESFSQAVYAAEGLQEAGDRTAGPPAPEGSQPAGPDEGHESSR
jgi:hypothetical protein